MPHVRLRLAQVGAPTAFPRRCGYDGDMVPIAGHPLQASFLGGEFDSLVNELGTSLLCSSFPLQLVEGISGPGALLLGIVLAIVHLVALEHIGPQAISQGLARRHLGPHRSTLVRWAMGLRNLRNKLR